ncbi:MAG: hypothetical protein WDW38_006990 [Sanguina aurantia]
MVSNSLFRQLWMGHKIHCLAASVLWKVPLWKQMKTCGHHRGGLAEVFLVNKERETILMSSRKGYIRMAVEYGIPIVPVFHFGNSQLFEFWPKVIQPLARRLRLVMGIMIGVKGLPIPRPVPLFMVVGRPIAVLKLSPDHPAYESHVDKAHAAVIASVEDLYARYAPLYYEGSNMRPLEIL